MTGRELPHDRDAERHVIGACMLRREVIGPVLSMVNAADFVSTEAAESFATIALLWQRGEPVDAHTVLAAQAKHGLPAGELVECTSSVPATGHAEKYARIVAEHAARRRLIDLAADLVDKAYSLGDPGDVLDRHRAALESVDLPSARLPSDFMLLDSLLDAPVESRAPWVVPGLLRRDWRVIVVAPEGAGKTLLCQLVAVSAAQGVHPLTHQQIPPVRVLMVDLENPEERIVHGCVPIRAQVQKRSAAYDSGRAMLWHRPGGIDLRTRAHAAELEAILTAARPQLVVMGPAYKASVRHKGEGWDEGAAAVQRVLDGLRTRFGFALLMEDHAPQSSGGVRDLRPFGSSLWLRWPEIGIKLAPSSEPPAPRVLQLQRWRGDRLPNDWPDRLEQANDWPWVGVWNDGMPRYEEVA